MRHSTGFVGKLVSIQDEEHNNEEDEDDEDDDDEEEEEEEEEEEAEELAEEVAEEVAEEEEEQGLPSTTTRAGATPSNPASSPSTRAIHSASPVALPDNTTAGG